MRVAEAEGAIATGAAGDVRARRAPGSVRPRLGPRRAPEGADEVGQDRGLSDVQVSIGATGRGRDNEAEAGWERIRVVRRQVPDLVTVVCSPVHVNRRPGCHIDLELFHSPGVRMPVSGRESSAKRRAWRLDDLQLFFRVKEKKTKERKKEQTAELLSPDE